MKIGILKQRCFSIKYPRDFIIYEPFLFDVELVDILRRRYDERVVSTIIEKLEN